MPNLSPGGGLPTVSAAGDNDALLLRVNGDPSDSRIVVGNLLTPASIKAKYEANANTNALTDALLAKLNSIATGAEVNVQADWSAVSGDAFILNKPTLATVATTGDYADLLNPPSIPQSGVDFVPVTGGSFSGAIVTTQLTIGATPFTEASLIDLTDGGETTLHDHAAANVSLDQTNLVVASGATVQAYIESNDQALLKARNTGLLSGGGATDLGAGVVRIATGTGQILDITALPTLGYYNVSWAQTDINLSAVDQVYYIYVNSLGQVLSTTSEPGHAEYRDFIWLHRVSIRGGIVSGLTSIVAPTVQLNASLYDLWAAIGLIKEGLALTANGANLSLNIGAGNIYVPGIGFYANAKNPNEVTISAQSPLTFRHVLRDGTQGANTTILDVGNYDLNGVLTPVPNPGATAAIFQLMAFPGGPNYRVFYGQTTYSTVSAAFVALENGNYKPIIPATYESGAIVLGWIIAQKSATALNDGAQIFVTSNRFGEYGGGISTTGAVSLLAANNLSDLSSATTARTNLGVYSTAQVDTLVPDSTTQLPEGTNLYYTEARVTANTTVAANTAKLATIATGAEVNVNADWNAVSGDALILNKPTIPTSTTNLPEGTNLYYTEARVTANTTVAANTAKLATIATGAEVNVQSNWNETNSASDAFILNKPTIPTSTTNLAEGTNLYYTEARVTANTTVAANTAKLATIESGAEVNVNADWNAVSGDALILNKPTIPTSTTQITEGTRLYYTEARVTANTTVAANTAKLATIATGAEVNVNADWNAVSGDALILNKPTIPTSTTQIAEGTNLYFTNARSDASDSGQYAIAQTCELYVGAAATATGVDPERTADLEDVGFVGIAPYKGDRVGLYDPDDGRWYLRTVTNRGLTISGISNPAAGKIYDLYLGYLGVSLSLVATVWSDFTEGASTRLTDPIYLDGVPVNPIDPSYRLIGTFRTTGSGTTTSDSAQNRLVSNVVHKRWKSFSIDNDPVNYTYVTPTLREFGNGFPQRVRIAASEPTAIIVNSTLFCGSSGSLPVNGGTGGIGVNSTTARSGQSSGAINQSSLQRLLSVHSGIIPAGYNYLAMLELGFGGNGTTTGDIEMLRAGLNGTVYL